MVSWMMRGDGSVLVEWIEWMMCFTEIGDIGEGIELRRRGVVN